MAYGYGVILLNILFSMFKHKSIFFLIWWWLLSRAGPSTRATPIVRVLFFEIEFWKSKKMQTFMLIYPRAFIVDVNFTSCNLA